MLLTNLLSVFVFYFNFYALAQDASLLRADDLFRNYKIVPQIIPETPNYILEVVYPNETKVGFGNELTPTQVRDEPKVKWEATNEAKYVLVMSDPDATQVNGTLHWLVVNIPGHQVHDGKTVVEYIGSGPPNGTGLHRYIFTTYKMTGDVDFKETFIPKTSLYGRTQFSLKIFAEKYNLGEPFAGNFFRAQYDDYVPILRKQFSAESIKPKSVGEFIEKISTTIEETPSTETVITSTQKTTHLQSHHKTRFPNLSNETSTESIITNRTQINDSGTSDLLPSVKTITSYADTIYFTTTDSNSEQITNKNHIISKNIKEPTVSFVNDKPIDNQEEIEKVPNNTETATIVPENKIRVSYISNDSIIHTKAISENKPNVKTNTFETTSISTSEITETTNNDFLDNSNSKNTSEKSDKLLNFFIPNDEKLQKENENSSTKTTLPNENIEMSTKSIVIPNKLNANDQSIKTVEKSKTNIPIDIGTTTNNENEKNNKNENIIDVTTNKNMIDEEGATTLQKYETSTTSKEILNGTLKNDPQTLFISDALHGDIKEDIKAFEKEITENLEKKNAILESKIENIGKDSGTTTEMIIEDMNNSKAVPASPVLQMSALGPSDIMRECPKGSLPDGNGNCKSSDL